MNKYSLIICSDLTYNSTNNIINLLINIGGKLTHTLIDKPFYCYYIDQDNIIKSVSDEITIMNKLNRITLNYNDAVNFIDKYNL